MVIEKINILKNNVVSVTFNKGEICLFSRCVFLKANLKEGMDVPYDLIKNLESESNLEFAKEYALSMLDKKSYSSKELFNTLKKKYEPDVANKIVDDFKKIRLLNDITFLTERAIYFINQKMFGRKRVILELKRLGFTNEDIEKVIKNLDFKENENIKKIINKRYKNFFKDEKEKRRATAALLRYGYNMQDVKEALFS